MQIAIVAAGFTPGEADQLRRSMAAWKRTRRPGAVRATAASRACAANGYSAGVRRQRSTSRSSGFGEYGFPESHAASFALLAYVSSLAQVPPAGGVHAPRCSTASRWASTQPAQLVQDARRHGVEVRPADVQRSASGTARWRTARCGSGLRMVGGLAEGDGQAHRGGPPNRSVHDLKLERKAICVPRGGRRAAVAGRAPAPRALGRSGRGAPRAARRPGARAHAAACRRPAKARRSSPTTQARASRSAAIRSPCCGSAWTGCGSEGGGAEITAPRRSGARGAGWSPAGSGPTPRAEWFSSRSRTKPGA